MYLYVPIPRVALRFADHRQKSFALLISCERYDRQLYNPLRVIAEGVESQRELEFLRAHQCDEAQGYYFSRPVLPQHFAQLLKTGIPEQSVVVHR